MTQEGIYRARFKPLFRFFYYKNVPRADVEDLVQDTFLRFFERHTLDGLTETDCAKLLYGFARNVYREWVRAAIRRGVVELNDDFPDSSDEEDWEDDGTHELNGDERAALITAIDSLNPRLRQVITLRFLHGKTRRETAAVLGVPEKHVHVYQRRAIAALQAKVAKTVSPES